MTETCKKLKLLFLGGRNKHDIHPPCVVLSGWLQCNNLAKTTKTDLPALLFPGSPVAIAGSVKKPSPLIDAKINSQVQPYLYAMHENKAFVKELFHISTHRPISRLTVHAIQHSRDRTYQLDPRPTSPVPSMKKIVSCGVLSVPVTCKIATCIISVQ